MRVIDDQIADLQRIIDADEAILEHEKSSEKRAPLLAEISKMEDQIDQLQRKRENYRRCD